VFLAEFSHSISPGVEPLQSIDVVWVEQEQLHLVPLCVCGEWILHVPPPETLLQKEMSVLQAAVGVVDEGADPVDSVVRGALYLFPRSDDGGEEARPLLGRGFVG
jgi:hypothetical protein